MHRKPCGRELSSAASSGTRRAATSLEQQKDQDESTGMHLSGHDTLRCCRVLSVDRLESGAIDAEFGEAAWAGEPSEEWTMYPDYLLQVIQDERRREIEAVARSRLLGSPRRRRTPGLARRSAGRLIVRFGLWLLLLGSAGTFDDADPAA